MGADCSKQKSLHNNMSVLTKAPELINYSFMNNYDSGNGCRPSCINAKVKRWDNTGNNELGANACLIPQKCKPDDKIFLTADCMTASGFRRLDTYVSIDLKNPPKDISNNNGSLWIHH